jgi:hypothetical protein
MARKSAFKVTGASGGAPSAAGRAAKAAAAEAAKAVQDIGLVSINRFDLGLWQKFVGLAKMKGLTIPQATDEALRMWIKENLKSLEV